jgi:hypothetical protein
MFLLWFLKIAPLGMPDFLIGTDIAKRQVEKA